MRTRGTGFCLIDAPDIETAMHVHDEAHGDVAKDVIEVDLSAVQAFLGRVSDPEPAPPSESAAVDKALRAIMFTDIVNSTALTSRLGDERAVEMVRAHDAMVRRSLGDHKGRVVKRTGDGIMASFDAVTAAVRAAPRSQQAFEGFNLGQPREAPRPYRPRRGRTRRGQQRPVRLDGPDGRAALRGRGRQVDPDIAGGP